MQCADDSHTIHTQAVGTRYPGKFIGKEVASYSGEIHRLLGPILVTALYFTIHT